MLYKVVEVISVEDSVIKVNNNFSCQKCKEGIGCGKGMFFWWSNAEFVINNDLGITLSSGDKIKIGLSNLNLLKSSFFIYLIPLLFLVFSLVLGHLLSVNEPIQIAISFVLLVLSFVLANFLYKQSQDWDIRIINRITNKINR